LVFPLPPGSTRVFPWETPTATPGDHAAPADNPGSRGAQGAAAQRGQLHGSHAAGDAGPCGGWEDGMTLALGG